MKAFFDSVRLGNGVFCPKGQARNLFSVLVNQDIAENISLGYGGNGKGSDIRPNGVFCRAYFLNLRKSGVVRDLDKGDGAVDNGQSKGNLAAPNKSVVMVFGKALFKQSNMVIPIV